MEVIIKTIDAVILVIVIGNSISVLLVKTIILADGVEIPIGTIKIVKIVLYKTFEKSLIVTYNLTYYIGGCNFCSLISGENSRSSVIIIGGFLV
ncbi:MAG: hypothetical protein DHS20C13_04860 [Thermodesulfobacteriota bacterium]|nr:MAG: hypothetical protein DHS20C13_04860 [Thermodesulfobacteriota bacterium]